MKCQRCKEREANVQIMQQIAGKKPQTIMLCDVCARELGISLPSFPISGKAASNPFSMMGNIFQSNFGLGADAPKDMPVSRCPECKITFEEFKKTGLLGCPQCYETFAMQMDPVFARTQMGKKHVGRKLGCKSAGNGSDENSTDESCEIDTTVTGSLSSSGKSQDISEVKSASPPDDKSAGAKPGKKKKIGVRRSSKTADEESEELSALERQHMNRLIDEKKAELAAAVSREDYLAAAKLRDEIAELTKKKEG